LHIVKSGLKVTASQKGKEIEAFVDRKGKCWGHYK